ncbi:MAG: gluconokinase [Candidatus Obscuribacterales bacterium]|jgi:gluconokinase
MCLVIIVMGVSGSGKSTVAQALALALNLRYFDADNFHSDVNKAKMASGHALTDADRQPWLDSLASGVEQWQSEDQGAVIACSALKESYRTKLINHSQRVKLVYLKASYEEIHKRLEQRKNHFMKADMLKSQFATLEEPKDAIVVQACLDLETIVEKVKAALETNEHT